MNSIRTRLEQLRSLISQRGGAGTTPRLRSGTATVEAAICFPLVFIMVFGAIELTNGIFLRQTLTVAAYEGGRAACRAGGTAQGARQRIEEILRARGVERQEIVITPNVTAATPRGTLINVTVRTSGDTRLTTPFTRYLQGRSLEHTVVMVRL